MDEHLPWADGTLILAITVVIDMMVDQGREQRRSLSGVA
jgi:hypothetical protein